MEATRMVRRRRPGVAALLALGVIGLALAIVAGRPGPGPVLTTRGSAIIGTDLYGKLQLPENVGKRALWRAVACG